MNIDNLQLTDREFIQVLDGVLSKKIRVCDDCYWCASSDIPDKQSVVHLVTGEIQFTAPMKVWMKSRVGNTVIEILPISEVIVNHPA